MGVGASTSASTQPSVVEKLVDSSMAAGGALSQPSPSAVEAVYDEYVDLDKEDLGDEQLAQFLAAYGAAGKAASEAHQQKLQSEAPPSRGNCSCGLFSSANPVPREPSVGSSPMLGGDTTLEELDKNDAVLRTFSKMSNEAPSLAPRCRKALLGEAKTGTISKDRFVANFPSLLSLLESLERPPPLPSSPVKPTMPGTGGTITTFSTPRAPAAAAAPGTSTTSPTNAKAAVSGEGSPRSPISPMTAASTMASLPTGAPAPEDEIFTVPAGPKVAPTFVGKYTCCGNHNHRPKFKNENGAIIFFDRHWKMSMIDDVATYSYGIRSGSRRVPAGTWEAPPFNGQATGPVVLRHTA